MLFHLACWIVLSALGAVIGDAILLIPKPSVFYHVGDRVIAATWLGLLAIASALLGLSVIVPLTPDIGLSLIHI